MSTSSLPRLADLEAARQRIRPHAHVTPVLTCTGLDQITGARLHFKCENFQKMGAFKFRGACNAVLSLDEETARRGVATHSSGNHGAAVALAARLRGLDAAIVMPEGASRAKRDAVLRYGGRITWCAPSLAGREQTLDTLVADSGASVIHPYDDARVVAGQATAAMELLEQVAGLDVIVAPVGGGGLVGGTALAVSHLAPNVTVIGAEPAGADDAARSLAAGRRITDVVPHTVADGLRGTIGHLNFRILEAHVGTIATVSEEAIVAAMRTVWERMKILVEPSAAVPLAALLENRIDVRGARVGVILSGGNVDLDRLPWLDG